MNKTADQLPKREARFPVLEGKSIKVTIEHRGDSPSQEIDAELIDISHGGIKLTVPSCPAVQEAIVLKLVVPEVELDLSIDAKVGWTRPAPGDAWYLGCTLNPELPDHILTSLTVKGHLQRRRDPRQPLDLTADMRSEGSQESAPVRLVDHSSRGFRLKSPQAAAPGGRLLLRFAEGSK